MPDYRKAIHRPSNPSTYDGNGKIYDLERQSGVKLVPDKSGKGWRKTGLSKEGKRLATIQDDSATKQISEIESLKKENEKLSKTNQDMLALVKDMDKRLKGLEGGK